METRRRGKDDGASRCRRTFAAIEADRIHEHTEEARRKMSEAHRRRGTIPPAAGRAWTAQEDALLDTLTDPEVLERTGRTPNAVRIRRRRTGR